MGLVICDRCTEVIDIDSHSEDIITVDDKEICIDCATEVEVEEYEKQFNTFKEVDGG